MKNKNQVRYQGEVEKVKFIVMPRFGTGSMKSLSKLDVSKRTFVGEKSSKKSSLWNNVDRAEEKAYKLANNHSGAWVKKVFVPKVIEHAI